MGISEKVAYLKGLAEGLKLDAESNEGKLFAAIIDVLDQMADEIADMQDEMVDIEDGLDAVSDDLSEVEESLYELDDEEEEEWDDEDGEVVCPNCGTKLEFDLSDLANALNEAADEDDE
mgnify:CR=1 FL=1